MKKLLGTALSAAMVLSTMPLHAELLKNLSVNGDVDVQGISANNVGNFNSSKYENIGTVQTRLMLNAGWDLLDDVHSMVTLRKNDNSWGNSSQSLDGSGTGGTSGSVLNNIFVDQAYFKVDKVFGAVDMKIGRQFYGDKGDAVIYFGPLDNVYGLGVSAVDVARFDWDSSLVGLTGIAGKVSYPSANNPTPGNLSSSDAGDVDLTGIRAAIKGNDMANGSVYIYNAETHATIGEVGTTPAPNTYLWVAGLKGKLTAGGAWLKGEYDQNFGEDRTDANAKGGSYTGWEFLTDLGYKADVTNVGGITGWGNFGVGSGDSSSSNHSFTSIASDYQTGGIYTMFAPYSGNAAAGNTIGQPATLGGVNPGGSGVSTNSLSDRLIWGLGVKVNPAAAPKLTAGLAYWDYHVQSVAGSGITNNHIGDELDLNFNWQHSDNVAFGIGLGTFQAGGGLNQYLTASEVGAKTAAHSPVTLLSATTSVKF